MKTLYLLCGPAGSGKSTWAQGKMVEAPNSIWISRDKIRFGLLKDGEDYFLHEEEVIRTFISCINSAISGSWETIIADATFLTEKARNRILNKLNLDGVDICPVNFHTDVEVCVQRNNMRFGRERVPEEVVRSMCRSFKPATANEKYEYSKIIEV